MNSYEIRN